MPGFEVRAWCLRSLQILLLLFPFYLKKEIAPEDNPFY